MGFDSRFSVGSRGRWLRHAGVSAALLAPVLGGSVVLSVSSSALAQSSAQISGTVTDSTGAVIPSASVSIKNLGTNNERTVQTTGSGGYEFTNLEPGSYQITATGTGFERYQAAVVVNVGGRYTVDPKLPAGSSSTTVEVSAGDTAVVNTATPEVSQVITQEQITQLPSLTRNPYDFVALSGNVSNGDNSASNNASQNNTTRGVSFSLNGSRTSGTEILLDGVENISVFGDTVAAIVPVDAVQEYRVITNNFSPEYGRASGGVVSVATVAGTNTLHGRLWEFNRISATTANTVTNAQDGVPKGVYTRNQFGGIVSGPILKDKLFFMGAAEFTRVRSSANLVASIPTSQFLAVAPANLQSYFSTYGATNAGTVLSTTSNLQAGGGTKPLYANLPSTLPVFSKVSFSAPNDAGGGLPQNTYNIVGRVDYNLGSATQLFFRYVNYHENDLLGATFASPYSQYDVGGSNHVQAYLLSGAHEFNSAFSALTRLSFIRANTGDSYNTSLQNTPTLFISTNARDPFSQTPFYLPGFFSTNPAVGGLPFGGPQNTIQYNQDLNYLAGKHQIQVGGQVLYIQDNHGYGAYAQANEQLGNNQAAGLANLNTGNLYQFQAAVNPNGAVPCARNPYTAALIQTSACTINLPVSQPTFARSNRFHDWAAYAQDQFKVTPALTVNYGVRYEYFGVQHNNNQNLDANFYYGPGANIPAQVRSGGAFTVPNSPIHRLWNPQYGTVSPRIGLAYDVFGNGKTSIRGGYGISYERNFGNVTFNVIQNPPNYAVVVLRSTSAQTYTVTNSNTGPLQGTGAVPLPPTSLRHVDQNIRTAQTQFHSLSVDQQLGRGTLVSVSYNGSRGTHLYDIKNYNIAGMGNLYLGDPVVDPITGRKGLTYNNPQFSNDNNRGSNGDSYYNALNVQFTAHDVHRSGLSLVTNYTYAHSLDDLSSTFSESGAANNVGGLGYMNAFDPGLDHGNSDFDFTHRLVLAPIYRTPSFFRDKGKALAQLLGGYEVTGIYTVRTGTPFTFSDSTNNRSGYGLVRYNPATSSFQHTFKNIPTGTPSNGNNYVISGATALPVDVPFGNPALLGISDLGPYPSTMTARNAFRGPGAYNLNVSVSKTFPIHERLNLELRAEGFDVTNHHNLYIQESQLDAANYGGGNPQVIASKGGVGTNGGANDERRFLQFAGKINF